MDSHPMVILSHSGVFWVKISRIVWEKWGKWIAPKLKITDFLRLIFWLELEHPHPPGTVTQSSGTWPSPRLKVTGMMLGSLLRMSGKFWPHNMNATIKPWPSMALNSSHSTSKLPHMSHSNHRFYHAQHGFEEQPWRPVAGFQKLRGLSLGFHFST